MKFVTLRTERIHRGINYINYSKQKKLRYEKINPDPYAKRAARRVAATPAVRSHRVGPASRTPPGPACRLLEDPHLAVSCAHGTNRSSTTPGAGNRFTATCGSNIPNGSSQMANPPCASWKSSTL